MLTDLLGSHVLKVTVLIADEVQQLTSDKVHFDVNDCAKKELISNSCGDTGFEEAVPVF